MNEQFPHKFGEYILLERIAIGGMAEIFRAQAPRQSQQEICIKRILPHYSEDDAFVKMFIDEATIAAKLDQENIVQIYDFDIIDDSYYIAMELVVGRDLKQTLETGARQGVRLTPGQVAYIASELCKALQYAHTKAVDGKPLNIIHRDVSPHNVLLGFNGDVKLTDFGIAKAASRLTTTRAGTVKGKCAYMSPEQARGRNLDHRSDIFSVGILMHEMLTGRRLFSGESDFDILTKVLKEPITPPTQLNPDVPSELEDICLKALERERNRRYRSCQQLHDDLVGWLQRVGVDRESGGIDRFLQALFGVTTEAPSDVQATVNSGSRGVDAVPRPIAPPPGGNGGAIDNSDMKTQQFDREALMSGQANPISPPPESLTPAQKTMALDSVDVSGMNPEEQALVSNANAPTGPQPLGGGAGAAPSPSGSVDAAMAPRMIVPAPSGVVDAVAPDDKTAMMDISQFEAQMKAQEAKRAAPPPARSGSSSAMVRAEQPPVAPPPQKKKGKGGLIFGTTFLFLILGFGGCLLVGAGVWVYTQTDLISGATASTDNGSTTGNGSSGSDDGSGEEGSSGSDDGSATNAVGGASNTEEGGDDSAGNDGDETTDGDGDGDDSVANEDSDAGTEESDQDAGDGQAEGLVVKVETTPPGAKVFLGDEEQKGKTPLDITTDKQPGDKLELKVTARGFKDQEVEYEIVDGDNKIEIELERVEDPLADLTPEEREARRKRIEEQRKKAAEAKGDGFVTINAFPWAEVYVDGKRLGRTPIRQYKVRSGRHTVLFKNPDLNKTARKRININKDEKITVFHNFKK